MNTESILLKSTKRKIGDEEIESFYLGQDPITVRQLIAVLKHLPEELLDAKATRGDFYEAMDIGFIDVHRVKGNITSVEFN